MDVRMVRIDGPKLNSLEYAGCFTFFPGSEALKELEFVQFHLIPKRLNDREWSRNILGSFAHSKQLRLICQNERVIIFFEDLREPLLPIVMTSVASESSESKRDEYSVIVVGQRGDIKHSS